MQRNFPFLSQMPKPKAAPDELLSMIRTDCEAIRVSIRLHNFKASWYAAQLGISEPYFSQIVNGRRPVPDWFVAPFCALAGTVLLQQHRDLRTALEAIKHRNEEAARADRLARLIQEAA